MDQTVMIAVSNNFAAIKDDVVLENGKGFLLNRKAELTGTPFVWTVPAETIAD